MINNFSKQTIRKISKKLLVSNNNINGKQNNKCKTKNTDENIR